MCSNQYHFDHVSSNPSTNKDTCQMTHFSTKTRSHPHLIPTRGKILILSEQKKGNGHESI